MVSFWLFVNQSTAFVVFDIQRYVVPRNSSNTVTIASIWRTFGAFVVIICHCVVIIGVYVFYVIVLLIGLSSVRLVVLQLALSVFKLTWSHFYIKGTVRSLKLSTEYRNVCILFMVLFTYLHFW